MCTLPGQLCVPLERSNQFISIWSLISDQIENLKKKMETNQTDKMKAERQCQEAQTKLEVLSKYFKEKEAELTRYFI